MAATVNISLVPKCMGHCNLASIITACKIFEYAWTKKLAVQKGKVVKVNLQPFAVFILSHNPTKRSPLKVNQSDSKSSFF